MRRVLLTAKQNMLCVHLQILKYTLNFVNQDKCNNDNNNNKSCVIVVAFDIVLVRNKTNASTI